MTKVLLSVGLTINWILGSNFPVKPTVIQILPLFMRVAGNVVGVGYIKFFSNGDVIYHVLLMVHKCSLMSKD